MTRVLISGATSGIGLATARAFHARGDEVILLGRRAERLAQIRSELGERCEVLALDVRDAAATRELGGREVDVLVNNAGLAAGVDPVGSADPNDWDRMIDTNVKGLLYLTRAILPGMIARGRGHVVNVGSVAGRYVYPGGAVYCATKFAVRALTEGLRLDLLGTGVRVTTIAPGMVETEFSEVRLNDAAKARQLYVGMDPLTAADIAEAIVWAASRPARVNVQELVIFPTDQAGVGHVARRPT